MGILFQQLAAYLDGKKTIVGGVLMVVLGIVQIAMHYPIDGAQEILLGLTLIWSRIGMQKTVAKVEQAVQVQAAETRQDVATAMSGVHAATMTMAQNAYEAGKASAPTLPIDPMRQVPRG